MSGLDPKSKILNPPQVFKFCDLQLHAARYAFHAVVKHKYKVEMATFTLPDAEFEAKYRKAMENYDGIIANAVSGASHDANQAEMDKGFE